MADIATKFGLGGGGGLILPGLPPLPFTSGDYIPPALAGIVVESGTMVAGVAIAIPFVVEYPTSVDGIVYRNNDTGANGQKVRTGLYRYTAHGVATQLQAATERTLTGSAATNVDSITSTQLVPGQRYCAVSVFDSATVMARIDNASTADLAAARSFNAPSGKIFAGEMNPTQSALSVFGCYFMTHAYAALPATYTATSVANDAFTPYLALKVA